MFRILWKCWMFPLRTWRMMHLPFMLKLVLCIAGLFLTLTIFLYIALIHMLGTNRLKNANFLEIHKCPACFGMSACSMLQEGKVTLEGIYRFPFTDNMNVKNVLHGKFNSSRVVVKRLAHTEELADLDAEICKAAGLMKQCDVTFAIYAMKPFHDQEMIPRLFTNMSDMCACPSQRLLDKKIKENYAEKQSEFDFTHKEKAYLVTTLMTNPEPIILQAFPQSEGWPFPKYIGACGRVIIEEYVGKMLSSYYNAPWEERVDFAYQVMKIMEMFTNHFEGFALYWTDLDWENLAVNADGRVMVVDAENIFVVDKAKIRREKLPGWDEPYYATYDVCKSWHTSCLSFKTSQLCSRFTVDFNYYTACRNLLSSDASTWWHPGGLLHNLPTHIEQKWHLSELLNNCSNPSISGERMQLKDKILETLKRIRQEVF